MAQTSIEDTSFWQKLTDQQTTTTVGLGYVTTDPYDPSTSYWPGPGCLPSFKLGREWITHYTSAKYASYTNDSATSRQSLDLADFDMGIQDVHVHQREDQDSFVSDILITYKLKNPAQFLRDVFDARELQEFASRYPPGMPLYTVTGYKVSRNVSTALEQQESRDNDLTFRLSTKLVVPIKLGLPKAGINADSTRNGLTSITYQAPGDSIFFVRYQRLQLDKTYPDILYIPPKPLTWKEWSGGGMWTKQARTIILPKMHDSNQRLLVTTDPIAVAVKKMQEMRQLPATGRRTTVASSDELSAETTPAKQSSALATL